MAERTAINHTRIDTASFSTFNPSFLWAPTKIEVIHPSIDLLLQEIRVVSLHLKSRSLCQELQTGLWIPAGALFYVFHFVYRICQKALFFSRFRLFLRLMFYSCEWVNFFHLNDLRFCGFRLFGRRRTFFIVGLFVHSILSRSIYRNLGEFNCVIFILVLLKSNSIYT